jgi:purine-nucleoside phosphorylase
MTAQKTVSQEIEQLANLVRRRADASPRVGLVLGSGLGSFADGLTDIVKIPYQEIDGMPASSVVGHAGNLCFGKVQNVPVVCMQGRVHLYEGHSPTVVVTGVRLMARLGVQTVLITNAAGGVETTWAAGDLMLVTDHLNLTGSSPLTGHNDDAVGVRFPDMTRAYDVDVQSAARTVAKTLGIELREGIYAGLLGPTYETPAEVRMLRTLGAHAVGMSTVHEVIALRHMGVRVGALSCITNMAAGITNELLAHSDVETIAAARREDLKRLLSGWITHVGGPPG